MIAEQGTQMVTTNRVGAAPLIFQIEHPFASQPIQPAVADEVEDVIFALA